MRPGSRSPPTTALSDIPRRMAFRGCCSPRQSRWSLAASSWSRWVWRRGWRRLCFAGFCVFTAVMFHRDFRRARATAAFRKGPSPSPAGFWFWRAAVRVHWSLDRMVTRALDASATPAAEWVPHPEPRQKARIPCPSRIAHLEYPERPQNQCGAGRNGAALFRPSGEHRQERAIPPRLPEDQPEQPDSGDCRSREVLADSRSASLNRARS